MIQAISNPVKGCSVTISDDLGNKFDFTETDVINIKNTSTLGEDKESII